MKVRDLITMLSDINEPDAIVHDEAGNPITGCTYGPGKDGYTVELYTDSDEPEDVPEPANAMQAATGRSYDA